MRTLILVLALVVAGCDGNSNPPPDLPDGMTDPPPPSPLGTPTRLVPGADRHVNGITDDNYVIYTTVTNDGPTVSAIPVAGGAPVEIAPATPRVRVRGRFVIADEESPSWAWSASSGLHKFPSWDGFTIVSPDGRYILYETARDVVKRYDLWLAVTDGSVAPVKLFEDIALCLPFAHFTDTQAALTYCAEEAPRRPAVLTLVQLATGKTRQLATNIDSKFDGEGDLIVYRDVAGTTTTALRLSTGVATDLPGSAGTWALTSDASVLFIDGDDKHLRRARFEPALAITDLTVTDGPTIARLVASPDGKTVAWNDFNTGFLLFDAATPRPMPLYSRLVHTNFASPSVDRKNHAFTDDSRFAFFREEAPSPRASIGRLQAVDLTNAQARVLAQLSDGLSAAGGSRVIFTDNLTQMSGMRAVGDLFIADLASPAAPTKIASHFVYGYGLDAKKKTLAYSVDGAKSGVYVVPLQ